MLKKQLKRTSKKMLVVARGIRKREVQKETRKAITD